MRHELHPLGVSVSVVQPGATRTPTRDEFEAIDLSPYCGSVCEVAASRVRRKAVCKGFDGQSLKRVAEAIMYSPTAKQPPSRVRIQHRRTSRLFDSRLPLFPDRIIDRNPEEVVWQ